MPTKGTPVRRIRIPDEDWDRAKARAERLGTTLAVVIRRYVKRYGRDPTRPSEESFRKVGG